jgi:hypothetical protein
MTQHIYASDKVETLEWRAWDSTKSVKVYQTSTSYASKYSHDIFRNFIMTTCLGITMIKNVYHICDILPNIIFTESSYVSDIQ